MALSSGATQILAAAESLFAKHGYNGVSIQQIASEAGISKANIYHHFHSKDELYLAVLKYALQDMNNLLAEFPKSDDSPMQQLAHFASEHLKHINANANISRLMLREMLDGGSSRGRELAEQVFSEYFTKLRSLLCKAQTCGEIKADINPDHIAVALAGLNVFLFQAWATLAHLPGNAFKHQQASGKIMFELLLHGAVSQGGKHA